jgi:hypothetical protein
VIEMSDLGAKLVNYVIYYEDWSGGESVTVIDTTKPNDATNLVASNVLSTTLTLSWTASTSDDVTGYDIFMDTSLLGTTANTSYTVTGLIPETTYTFIIKAQNKAGISADGVSVTAATSKAQYALAMNGTSDYILTPLIQYDSVVMDFSAEQKAGTYAAYLDASRNIALSAFGRDSSGRDYLQAAWQSINVDGVDKTSSAGVSAIIPTNQRTTVIITFKSAGKATTIIFANQLGQIPMKGILYNVKFLLGGKVIALYDFNVPVSGSTIPDSSGNNNAASAHGGTWISR